MERTLNSGFILKSEQITFCIPTEKSIHILFCVYAEGQKPLYFPFPLCKNYFLVPLIQHLSKEGVFYMTGPLTYYF